MGLLKDLFGNNGGPKVADYILSHPTEFITRIQIQEGAQLSYSCVDRVLKELLEKEFILKEKVGKRTIYKLNKQNKLVKKLEKIYPKIQQTQKK